MTCDDALSTMLSADLAELVTTHPGPLGRHLATCARCGRVAAHLREDTAQLAMAVARPRPAAVPAPWRLAPWLVGAAAAVAVVVPLLGPREAVVAPPLPVTVVVGGGNDVAVIPPDAHDPVPAVARRGAPAATPAGAAAPGRVVDPVGTAAHVLEAVPHVAPTAAVATAFAAPAPIEATSLHAAPVLAVALRPAPQARTRPPPNTHATVIASPDPGVTALWFH